MPDFAARSFQNVAYAQGSDGSRLLFDGYVPAGTVPHPAAIIVHGGGWVGGDRRWNVEPLFDTLTQAGFAWFSISYTLAKDVARMGTAADDVKMAILYIAAHAAEYNVDPARMVLIGESAGAQLATMAVLDNAGLPIRAIVDFYMPSDLQALARSNQHSKALGFMNATLAGFLTPRLRGLSPVHQVRKGTPPILLIHGTADPLIPFEQSLDMCRAARQAGGVCELISVRNGVHGMRRWEAAGQTGYKKLMLAWLQKHAR